MAEKAFAISPVTASGVMPTDADYDAISEAFMETARGRWFLREYARRNRNADTATVLEAVARIERSLAAQKEPADTSDTIAAMTSILAIAREGAEAVFAEPAREDLLAQSFRCAGVIREIAWGLREAGADGRICGLLDAQADAISSACADFSTNNLRDGVLEAFDEAATKIAELAAPSSEAASPAATPRTEPSVVKLEARPSATERKIIATPVDTVALAPVKTADAPPPAETSVTPTVPPVTPAAKALDETSLHASIGGSLGASLLVSGLVAKPSAPKSDPLAPIRRMSAAEKIAFFS